MTTVSIDREWQRFYTQTNVRPRICCLPASGAPSCGLGRRQEVIRVPIRRQPSLLICSERMVPMDYAFYPESIQYAAMIETFAIATLGTLFTLVFMGSLAPMNALNITPNKVLWTGLLNSSRVFNVLWTHWFGHYCLSDCLAPVFRRWSWRLPFVVSAL